MGLVAQNKGGDFELCPAGIHSAVCYAVADLGLQNNPFTPDKPQHKCVVMWELEPRMSDGRRFGLSKFYTLSLNEKATLRKDLISWRGKNFTKEELDMGFDIEKLMGANCTLNVVHETKNDKTYAKIAGVMPPMKDKIKMERENSGVPQWVVDIAAKQIINNCSGNPTPYQPNQEEDSGLPF